MPIYVPGKSTCPLCEQTLERGQDLLGFPAFLKASHRLSLLSDAVVHRGCFDGWEHHDRFVEILQRFKAIMDSAPRDSMSWKEGEKWIQEQQAQLDAWVTATDSAEKQDDSHESRGDPPPGSTWRIGAQRGDERFEVENEGVLDEVVIDRWLHLEQMDENEWWMRVGDARIWIRIDAGGDAHIDVERNAYESGTNKGRRLAEDLDHFRETHARWQRNVGLEIDSDEVTDGERRRQCFACRYYLPLTGAFAEDWGVCSNASSPRDGRATFEHDGCEGWKAADEAQPK